MMNSLFILNSINNHILNNSQVQIVIFTPILQALGIIVTGIAKGVMASVALLIAQTIVGIAVIVGLAVLIDWSIKNRKNSKDADKKFVINYRKSSALVLKDSQDIVFDGDLFGVNNVLNLVIPLKSDLAPIRWYIKYKPNSMSYTEINQYFLFKNYNNPIRVQSDGLITRLIISGGMPDATFYIQYEKIKNLPDGKSIIVCFELSKYSTVNGYYTDNICIEIK